MYTLTVTPEELEAIGDGLDTLPYKRVAPLIDKLRGQLAAQNAPPAAPTPVEPAPAPVVEPEVQAAPVEAPVENA